MRRGSRGGVTCTVDCATIYTRSFVREALLLEQVGDTNLLWSESLAIVRPHMLFDLGNADGEDSLVVRKLGFQLSSPCPALSSRVDESPVHGQVSIGDGNSRCYCFALPVPSKSLYRRTGARSYRFRHSLHRRSQSLQGVGGGG